MAELPICTPTSDGVVLSVHAQPGARRSELRGRHGEALKIAVQAVAEEGRANQALAEFIALSLALTTRDVSLISGQSHRSKRFLLRGDADELSRRIEQWLQSS